MDGDWTFPVGVVGSGQSVQKFPRFVLPLFCTIQYFLVFFVHHSVICGTALELLGMWYVRRVFQELFSLTYNTDRAAAREI